MPVNRKGPSLTDTARLAPGDKAPTFTLPDADGKKVSLADYKGRRVIVYFYPAARRPAAPSRPATSATAWPNSTAPASSRRHLPGQAGEAGQVP